MLSSTRTTSSRCPRERTAGCLLMCLAATADPAGETPVNRTDRWEETLVGCSVRPMFTGLAVPSWRWPVVAYGCAASR